MPTSGSPDYRALVESASDLIALLDGEGRILYVNPSARRVLGHEPHELEGRPAFDFVRPDEVDALRERLRRMLLPADEEAAPVELHFRDRKGSWRRLEASGRRLSGPDARIVLSVRDVTRSRRAEHVRLRSEEHYQALFEGNPFPLWVYDLGTLRFLAVNDSAVEHYGYSREEFLEMTIRDIRPPDELDRLEEDVAAVRTGAIDPGSWNAAHWRHRKKDGTVFEVEIRSSTLSFGGWPARLVLAKDVSAERRLEEQLRQAQRMEAVGRLSAGVAHDFNNLLGIILGYGALLRPRLGGEWQRAKLAEIMKAGERAAGLTRQLLTFSRKQVMQPAVLDVSALVADLGRMLGRLVGEDVELVITLSADPGWVRADPGQVEQVVMNLVTNARDAMPRGGRLTLATANVVLGEADLGDAPSLAAGDYVCLAVSDTGVGMDAATRSRIFEPFFTTKELGRGTGLGLATVYGIVAQSGGHIRPRSEVGRGTTLEVFLPRVEAPAAPAEPGQAPGPGGGGSETILLVEDDEVLRELSREVLAGGGYRVICAPSGPEALAAAGRCTDRIHLLCTDVVMMGMSGRELSEELAALRPGLRVLFTSGYTDDAVLHHGVREQEMVFLQKPFAPDALLRKVRQALDA